MFRHHRRTTTFATTFNSLPLGFRSLKELLGSERLRDRGDDGRAGASDSTDGPVPTSTVGGAEIDRLENRAEEH